MTIDHFHLHSVAVLRLVVVGDTRLGLDLTRGCIYVETGRIRAFKTIDQRAPIAIGRRYWISNILACRSVFGNGQRLRKNIKFRHIVERHPNAIIRKGGGVGADRIAIHALGFEHFPRIFVVDNHRIGNALGHWQTNLDRHAQIAANIHLLAICEARLQGYVENCPPLRNGKSRLRGDRREIGNRQNCREGRLDGVVCKGVFCYGDSAALAGDVRKIDSRLVVLLKRRRRGDVGDGRGWDIDRHAGHGFCPIALALCVPGANANLVALTVLQAWVSIPRHLAQVRVERRVVGAPVDGLAVDPVAFLARADLCVIPEHGRFAGFVSHGVEVDTQRLIAGNDVKIGRRQ